MSRSMQAKTTPVEVVIPVYNAASDLARCVESVLAHTAGEYSLVLIDDASPDPAIAAYFAQLRERDLKHVALLRNEHNLGFTGTANRGMTRSRADIVLLNSDTVVTPGWLDALRRCAASSPHIGTVTPFSNNAEIVSFPRFCENNVWPVAADPEPIRAALASAAVPTYPELPTGVGFCMYVRRELIDAVGPFDMAFGAGYGEENDLCLRGFAVGYRNVLADDAFVLHTGGRSFQGRKEVLGVRNTTLLLERHPHYTDMVRDYIAQDPLAPLRAAATSALALRQQPAAGVLHVIHHHGGGTETHVRALISASRDRWRHYLVIAVGDRCQLEDHAVSGAAITYEFTREAGESWADFFRGLCASFAVGLVHLHNISGSHEGLQQALPEAGVPYGYTAHDLSFACPTITFLTPEGLYCGGRTDAQTCARCLAAQPAFAQVDIVDWRERHARLLDAAAFVIAPSQWAAGMVSRYFPACKPTIIAHGVQELTAARASATPVAVLMPDDHWQTVAVLGAIGPDKGARRLERLVALARERGLPLRFVLIGYLDRTLGPWQSDDTRLVVHGRYAPGDLPRLLAHYRAGIVLFPSAGPETFSYTLSEAWLAGLPVLVPPIGALAERVAAHGAGWIMTEAQWRDEGAMLDRLVDLLTASNSEALHAVARTARAVPRATPADMAEATVSLYAAAIRSPLARSAAFAPARLRDALGYRSWFPPPPVRDGSPQAAGPRRTFAASLARAALQVRHTALGRLAYRLAPERMLSVFRSHLH